MIPALAQASTVPTWLSGWVGLVVAILGLLSLIVGGAAYLRGGYLKATVATLAESNAALAEQVRILKDKVETAEAEAAADAEAAAEREANLSARLDDLVAERDVLREVIQGKADVDRLVMLLQDHHHAVMEDRGSFATEWRGELGKLQATADDTLTAVGELTTTSRATRAMVGRIYGSTVGDRT